MTEEKQVTPVQAFATIGCFALFLIVGISMALSSINEYYHPVNQTAQKIQNNELPSNSSGDGYRDGFKHGQNDLGPSGRERLSRSVIDRLITEECNKPECYKYGTKYHDDFVNGMRDGYNHYWDIKHEQESAKNKQKTMPVKKPVIQRTKQAQPEIVNNIPQSEIDGLIRSSGESYSLDSVKFTIRRYPNIVKSKDREGNTALHAAAEWGNTEIAAYLISRGADINAKNKNGCNPLMVAEIKEESFSGHKDVIALLKRSGTVSK